jgi:uncharacterized membrane protein YhaH (DUF805 family)
MTSNYQRARRKHFWIGYLLALIVFTAWVGVSSLAGKVTAEQPVISR